MFKTESMRLFLSKHKLGSPLSSLSGYWTMFFQVIFRISIFLSKIIHWGLNKFQKDIQLEKLEKIVYCSIIALMILPIFITFCYLLDIPHFPQTRQKQNSFFVNEIKDIPQFNRPKQTKMVKQTRFEQNHTFKQPIILKNTIKNKTISLQFEIQKPKPYSMDMKTQEIKPLNLSVPQKQQSRQFELKFEQVEKQFIQVKKQTKFNLTHQQRKVENKLSVKANSSQIKDQNRTTKGQIDYRDQLDGFQLTQPIISVNNSEFQLSAFDEDTKSDSEESHQNNFLAKLSVFKQSHLQSKKVDIYPFLSPKATSAKKKQGILQKTANIILGSLISYQKQFETLKKTIKDRALWESQGRFLTVIHLNSNFDKGLFVDKNWNLPLFSPNIFILQVPFDLPIDQQYRFIGIRFDPEQLKRKTTSAVIQELGIFRPKITDEQYKARRPVTRAFNCQDFICSQLYSLIKIESKYNLRIYSLKIYSSNIANETIQTFDLPNNLDHKINLDSRAQTLWE